MTNASYEKRRFDELMSILDILKETKQVDESKGSVYIQMRARINWIKAHQHEFIRDFLSKDQELREFLAVHSTNETKKSFFIPTLKEIQSRKVIVTKGMMAIIKEFDGVPIRAYNCPLVKITFDGRSFVIKDHGFEEDYEESEMSKWRKAPVIVL